MLDKKKEYIAEALDEIRDEYIEEAVSYQKPESKKRKKVPVYRMAGTIAACLAVVVVIGIGVRFSAPAGESIKNESAGAAGTAMEQVNESAGEITDGASPQDAAPEMESGATVTDLEGAVTEAGEQPAGSEGAASSLVWYDPEEIFAQDIVIVRGTVESLVQVEGTPVEGQSGAASYTQITVRVEDCLKGDLKEGETFVIKAPVVIDYQNYFSDYYGALTKLSEGSEAIFMPRVGEPYYFNEGRRYVFLETMEGVSYAEEVYEIPSEGAVTLDDVEAYIRDLLQ